VEAPGRPVYILALKAVFLEPVWKCREYVHRHLIAISTDFPSLYLSSSQTQHTLLCVIRGHQTAPQSPGRPLTEPPPDLRLAGKTTPSRSRESWRRVL
jgi:hypothetical protein